VDKLSARGKGIQPLLILVCWSLWRERNARVFVDREKHPSRLIDKKSAFSSSHIPADVLNESVAG
jgi:hypothetical protein